MAKAGNLKLDFMAKSIGIHFFEFEDMFRCLRDNENLKKTFSPYVHFKWDVLFSAECTIGMVWGLMPLKLYAYGNKAIRCKL